MDATSNPPHDAEPAPVPSSDLLTCRDALDGLAGLIACADPAKAMSLAAPTPRQVAAILFVIGAHMGEAMADLGLPSSLT